MLRLPRRRRASSGDDRRVVAHRELQREWAAPIDRSRAGDPFLVTFWCAPPLNELDDARAAEIAAGGFTTVGAPCEGPVTVELNRRALDVAGRHGLRIWVGDRRLRPAATAEADWDASLRAAVAAYRSHPALDGYVVADEPPASEFDAVAQIVAALRRADPDRLAYVNLLPDYVPPDALDRAPRRSG